jgi:hypothetical protein
LGQTPICYIPALSSYILISWYNPVPLKKWFEPSEMRYEFYQADHPWGPWSFINSISDEFLAPGSHMYGPSICAKFQEHNGSAVRVQMFTSGCQFEDKPAGIYKAWTIPVILRTEARPPSKIISATDSQLEITGDWATDQGKRTGSKPGASTTISFNGIEVDCIVSKAAGFGDMDVVIDGRPLGRVSLGLKNFPALSGVTVFRSRRLKPGTHALKLTNAGTGPVNIESVRIYSPGPL